MRDRRPFVAGFAFAGEATRALSIFSVAITAAAIWSLSTPIVENVSGSARRERLPAGS